MCGFNFNANGDDFRALPLRWELVATIRGASRCRGPGCGGDLRAMAVMPRAGGFADAGGCNGAGFTMANAAIAGFAQGGDGRY